MAFLSLRTKLFAALLVSTFFFGVAMVVFAQTVIRGKLVHELQEKGVAIARRVAADCVNPIITERFHEVAMLFRDLRSEEGDFVYAYVVGEDGRDLAHSFAGGIPPELKRAHLVDALSSDSTRELETDQGRVLDVGVPLLRGQAGVLHVGFSEAPISRDVRGIVLLITLFGVGTLVVGGAAAFGFSRVITRPLLRLAGAAESYGRAGTNEPVAVESDDEIGDLARVFNAMVENRRRIEAERERLIEELRHSLAEVKTLRGLLPICAACKKIRDDAGSWQQIESYVRNHSEAEFSHGLCPECARRLYPELRGKLAGREGG